MSTLTFAVCSYNRCQRLRQVLPEMRRQTAPVAFRVLVVDNNSTDATAEVVRSEAKRPGAPLDYVFEERQGISHARNRALAESLDNDYLVFIDDDEIPAPGLLAAAVRTMDDNGAACVGGRVKIRFPDDRRPGWLSDELKGFLAEVDYGEQPFWIQDQTTPIWTANIAYRMSLFREEPSLRFDARYNRAGNAVGGGEDAMMLRALLDRKVPIRYCPEMVVEHHVESWRLKRRYFLKLHFVAGRRFGQYETGVYTNAWLGVPPFMVTLLLRQSIRAAGMTLLRQPGALRQAMNASHAAGAILGRFNAWRAREGFQR